MTVQPKPQPRGIRNHNPGNIRRSKDKWQGLAEKQADRAFFTFKSPAWGIRALAVTLITYQDRHRRDSVRKIIGRWAPPSENDTDSYVTAVARHIGVEPDQRVNVHEYRVMRPLVEAIIRHENGQQPYPPEVIDEGLRRAGVKREGAAPAIRDPEVNATTVVTATTTLGGAAKAIQEAGDIAYASRPLIDVVVDVGPWVLLALVALCGGGYLLWKQLKRRRAESD